MADSDDFVQVPADGVGKKVFHLHKTVGADAVQIPVALIADPTDPTIMAAVTVDGLKVDVGASALPTGGATSANQDTEIASLSSIDAKMPSLGQALAAASVPVVLTAAQISAITPPAAITGFATSAKQDTGNTSVASIDTKTPALVSGRVPVDPSGVTSPVSLASVPSHAVTNAGVFAVQVSAALPAGTAAIGKLAANSGVDIGDVDVTSLPTVASAHNPGGQVTVTTSATTLLAAFATRKGAFIKAASDVFVKMGSGAALTCFLLEAGETMTLTGPLYTGIITAITSTGSATVYVMEW